MRVVCVCARARTWLESVITISQMPPGCIAIVCPAFNSFLSVVLFASRTPIRNRSSRIIGTVNTIDAPAKRASVMLRRGSSLGYATGNRESS